MALCLAAVGLFAPACVFDPENPKPSPFGHSERGTVTITAGDDACWTFVSYEASSTHREEDCGSREFAVRTGAGFFSVFVVKTDDSPATVSARLVSDGRTLDEGTATKRRDEIRLAG